jgi:hypothetical protein
MTEEQMTLIYDALEPLRQQEFKRGFNEGYETAKREFQKSDDK